MRCWSAAPPANWAAQISHIPATLDGASRIRDIEATAQLLGRLYDAVECQGIDEAVVRRLGLAASIPIYAGPGDAGASRRRAGPFAAGAGPAGREAALGAAGAAAAQHHLRG